MSIAQFLRIFLLLALCWSLNAQSAPMFNVDKQSKEVKAELIARTQEAIPGSVLEVGVLLNHEPGWHTFWKSTGDTGLPTTIKWELPENWVAGEILWPVPKIFRLGTLVNYGYDGQTLLPVQISIPNTAKVGEEVTIKAEVRWLMCSDQCIPGGADLSLQLLVGNNLLPTEKVSLFEEAEAKYPKEITEASAKIDPNSHLIELSIEEPSPLENSYVFVEGKESIVYGAEQSVSPTANGYSFFIQGDTLKAGDAVNGLITSDSGTKSFTATLAEGTVVRPAPQDLVGSTAGLWVTMCLAFIGGLILNLMPCVFPVLSLKLIGLLENRNKGSLVQHGFGFLIGVLASMVILAGILILLKQAGLAIGWGFQLQSPWFVGALALLFIAITANLLGLFEFTLSPVGQTASAKEKSPFAESFASGILAVIVASPCTAPFMGAALGYALGATTLEALGIFLCLGLGMALPWTLMALFPVLIKWLPKPGMWMVYFKKIMAIPMLLTAIWLFWILSQQIGTTSLVLLILAALLLAASLYLYGKSQYGAGFGKGTILTLFIGSLVLYAVASSHLIEPAPEPMKEANAWSVQAVDAALKDNQPVFVDFTASWCLTCQANKLTVLRSDSVQKAFKEYGFVVLEADWTNYDEEITKALEHFGRTGVPLYVIYKTDGSVEILPELLTTGVVVEALKKAATPS